MNLSKIKSTLWARQAFTKNMLWLSQDDSLSLKKTPWILYNTLTGKNKEAISFALDRVQWLSEVKQLTQSIIGKDIPTFEKLSMQRRWLQFVAWSSRILFYILTYVTVKDTIGDWIENDDYYRFFLLPLLYWLWPIAYRMNYYKKLEEFAENNTVNNNW